MEHEFRAITERLEPENLKPLQFEQSVNSSGQFSGQWPVASAREVGAPCLADSARRGNFGCATCLPDGFLCRRNCCIPRPRSRSSHPRLERVGTDLSYCTDEIPPASRNITLYVVGGYGIPPCIAQPLQQLPTLRVERKEEVGRTARAE
jgi:hypothetical protein